MNTEPTKISSWGNTIYSDQIIQSLFWHDDVISAEIAKNTFLPFGLRKSYGDSCLNHNGLGIDVSPLNRLISFDEATGVLVCGAGATLEQILQFIIPKGYFIPVTLGTKYITVGGAIANDVHGKNHHNAGTFGCHVLKFALLRSDGTQTICSLTNNPELFRATIGGLGLTGVILWAEIQMKKISSPLLDIEIIQFFDLNEYFALEEASREGYEHTSAWVNYLSDSDFGCGLFFRGNFSNKTPLKKIKTKSPINIPFFAPNHLLNNPFMNIFNWLYFHRMTDRVVKKTIHFDSFFFPLDSLGFWNRLYGKRGFFQYQFVIPIASTRQGMTEILQTLQSSKVRPYLTVLKTFGAKKSPGILSFPMEGLTVALDFPNLGVETRQLFFTLDELVAKYGGRIYPAKDARMSAAHFQQFFPHWKNITPFIDPKISSNFWRRVGCVPNA